MKKIIIIFLVAIFLISYVEAVGLSWRLETGAGIPGERLCYTYYVFHSGENPIRAKLEVSEELKTVATRVESEVKDVEGQTSPSNAVPVELCFTIPKDIYPEDCLLGSLVCEQTCGQPEVSYAGQVIATDMTPSGGGATGSSVLVQAAAPLTIKARCSPHPRDWSFVYIVLIVIVAVVIAVMLYKKYRTPPRERKLRKLKRLQEDLQKEKY